MDRENFARLIKRYRYERGISQREFAKLIGTGGRLGKRVGILQTRSFRRKLRRSNETVVSSKGEEATKQKGMRTRY